MKKIFLPLLASTLVTLSCASKFAPVAENALRPTAITQPTPNDTDDPAIWIHPTDASKSLIVGTDKEDGGGLYVYDLNGKIINKFIGMQRPNNVDIAYGLLINGVKTDIAVTTERNAKRLRVFSLPDLKPIDNGGISIFDGEIGEEAREGMGIALYTKKTGTNEIEIHAIVGRKTGPSGTYLWQYKLAVTPKGTVTGEVIRKFGTYSGNKEIEAIAVDNELGYIYYSDEGSGVRKYYADPEKGNNEIAFFAQNDAKRDHEGIAIYKTTHTTGYLLVSNQQNNSMMVYKREGSEMDPNHHQLIADISISAIECDGADATNVNLGTNYPKGVLVTMSNGNVFHLYDWRLLQKEIDKVQQK